MKMAVHEIEPTEDMLKLQKYAKWCSTVLLGFECDVKFISGHSPTNILADYDTANRTLRFWVRNAKIEVYNGLSKAWFNEDTTFTPKVTFPFKPTVGQTELILHELAHEGVTDHLSHTGEYVNRIAALGAKLTHIILNM